MPYEKGGSAGDAYYGTLPHILLHSLRVSTRIQACVERLLVEPQSTGLVFEGANTELTLFSEQQIVHLPELALLLGAQRSLRRFRGVGVYAEGKLTKDDAHLIGVLVFDPIECANELATVRTLEVRELDQGNWRVGGAGAGKAFGLEIEPVRLD
jgi:hypothetical protein